MRRLIGLAAGIAAVTGLLSGLSHLRAADSPFAGNWKVIIMAAGEEVGVWVVHLDQKDSKPQVNVVASLPNFKDTTVENVRIDDQSIRFTLKANGLNFEVAAYPRAGEKKLDKVFGSLQFRGQREFIRLERSEDKELDPKTAVKEGPAKADLKKVSSATDDKEREALLKELIKKYADQPVGYVAAQRLLGMAVKANAEADAKAAAEQAIQTASHFGPEMKLNATVLAARAFAPSDKLGALGLGYAQQAAKLLTDRDPATVQVPVLKVLAAALKKAGKTEEVKLLQARLVKLNEQLDEEFEKTAIPFKPEAFAGRKAKSDRVVAVELFTGAQCPPCVAADVAFDALLKTYQPADVVLLQYHLHIPGPDPLTNKDAERRSEYYGVQGTPSFYLNGKDGPLAGGPQQASREGYNTLRKRIDEALEEEPKAKLKLAAERKGDKIDLTAEVADLSKTGDDVRLRFVVIEDVVKYAGGNGQRLHHHVVRGFPGGVEGIALKEKAGKHSASVSVSELAKALAAYLAEFGKPGPGFPEDDRPLNLKNLKVVALIQDNATKEILQAAQIALPEAK